MVISKKEHWEMVYKTKTPNEVSWTQETPKSSLDFIDSCKLDKNAAIIDVGGGDSKLVDYLLEKGYNDITILDISEKAIERAQKRLGEKAKKVHWIVCNIVDFKPKRKFDIWHDRAAFHFLTKSSEIECYINLVNEFVEKNLIIATFSKNGPLKCSGLEICQYDEKNLSAVFEDKFKLLNYKQEDHKTPFDTYQNFIFCSFVKKENI